MTRVVKPVVQQSVKAEVSLERPVSDHKEVKKAKKSLDEGLVERRAKVESLTKILAEIKKMRQLMINQNRKTIELKVKEKENQTLTGNLVKTLAGILAKTFTGILAKILTGILAKTFPGNDDIEDRYGEEKADKFTKEEKEATIMEQHKPA